MKTSNSRHKLLRLALTAVILGGLNFIVLERVAAQTSAPRSPENFPPKNRKREALPKIMRSAAAIRLPSPICINMHNVHNDLSPFPASIRCRDRTYSKFPFQENSLASACIPILPNSRPSTFDFRPLISDDDLRYDQLSTNR